MRRRKCSHDPLEPIDDPRWLVVRNKHSQVVESKPLAPGADLRAILTAERNTRAKSGWIADPIKPLCGFFFCSRGAERVCVVIEAVEPRP